MRGDERTTRAARRLSAALRPDDDRVRRVISGALTGERTAHRRRSPRLLVAAATVLLLMIAALWWRTPPQAPSLHISGTGSVLVVTSEDGAQWIVRGSRETGPRGEYVILFPTKE